MNGEIAPDPNSIKPVVDRHLETQLGAQARLGRLPGADAGEAMIRVGGRRSDVTYRPSSSAGRDSKSA